MRIRYIPNIQDREWEKKQIARSLSKWRKEGEMLKKILKMSKRSLKEWLSRVESEIDLLEKQLTWTNGQISKLRKKSSV